MEAAFAILIGMFFTVAVYLLMSRQLVRVLLGIAILGNAVNLLIFTSGRLLREVPPVIPEALQVPEGTIANPLPQALILTAIVISFSFFAFLLVLSFRAYQELGTDNTVEMRVAEPTGETAPPQGY
ncbi:MULTISPECIES: Na+/H+ antiporter subunit C [Stappia]|jgi:multicomponent Na+:H+ antiporter subunit C|uniref:Na+/H+ antiporter subunit C n=1 Tax=Stappia indica TaxID=538381 RepID=A0A857CD46_9HYPH|nr:MULTISPECIES: Na+/H+ antiporter subunit C [Stappia]QGZ36775.1 Na+/H+ antiporter subunit C [Stappia indica]